MFWNAWQWTARREYLAPIAEGGAAAVTGVNANALDLLGLRETVGPKIGGPAPAADMRYAVGRGTPRPNPARQHNALHFRWQLTGDLAALERLYADQIEEMTVGEYINTTGSLWIDRVGVPTNEMQRERLGGIALTRNATNPGHVVSWKFAAPATAESVALLVADATTTSFQVTAFNLEKVPVGVEMTGWNIEPGTWTVVEGDDGAPATVTLGRSQSIPLTFAPGRQTVLHFKLRSPGTPNWLRPDLGIDPEDVVVNGRELRVKVHGLGGVDSPVTTVVWRDARGVVQATATVPALAAPVDLQPKTTEVVLKLAAGTVAASGTVEIDPEEKLEEITRLNNAVRVPAKRGE